MQDEHEQEVFIERNNEEKATTEQPKSSEAAALRSPGSGPKEVPQAARGSATARRWGRPGGTYDAKLGSG